MPSNYALSLTPDENLFLVTEQCSWLNTWPVFTRCQAAVLRALYSLYSMSLDKQPPAACQLRNINKLIINLTGMHSSSDTQQILLPEYPFCIWPLQLLAAAMPLSKNMTVHVSPVKRPGPFDNVPTFISHLSRVETVSSELTILFTSSRSSNMHVDGTKNAHARNLTLGLPTQSFAIGF